MTTLKVDETFNLILQECESLNLDISAADSANECKFFIQYYKKNIEELKNILNEFVQFAKKEEEYKDFKVDNQTINYKRILNSTTENLNIKDWSEYINFFSFDKSKKNNFFKIKIKGVPSEEEEKKNGWLLIIISILCVLGLGYYMMKGKKVKVEKNSLSICR